MNGVPFMHLLMSKRHSGVLADCSAGPQFRFVFGCDAIGIAMTLLEPCTSNFGSSTPLASQRVYLLHRPPSTRCRQVGIRSRRRHCTSARAAGPGIACHVSSGPPHGKDSPLPITDAQHAGRCEHHDVIPYSRAASLAAAAVVAMLPAPAMAALHAEPANALSLPTWAIHISRCAAAGLASLYHACCVLRCPLDGHAAVDWVTGACSTVTLRVPLHTV